MIVYKDMSFCARKGCGVKSCPRNLANVNWSLGLPVSVADFWRKSDRCPVEEPERIDFKYEEESENDD